MVTITMTREQFDAIFLDKAVQSIESPAATFASAIAQICSENGIDPDSVDTHSFMFALSLHILMRELGDAIFGKEEDNR